MFQNDLRFENERYIRQHPEIKHIMNYLIRNVLRDQPDNIPEYVGSMCVSLVNSVRHHQFIDLMSHSELKERVEEHVREQDRLHEWYQQVHDKLAKNTSDVLP